MTIFINFIKMKSIKINNKINELIILSIILIFFVYYAKLKSKNYEENYITLVTALYQLPTNRHKFNDYFVWIENFLKVINQLFFISKRIFLK